MIQIAWIIPGIYPRMVSNIFNQKSPVKPTSKKTPSGGRSIAKMIFKISIGVTLIDY